jgi:hypothetical protein
MLMFAAWRRNKGKEDILLDMEIKQDVWWFVVWTVFTSSNDTRGLETYFLPFLFEENKYVGLSVELIDTYRI